MELITSKYPPVWQSEIPEYPLYARGKVRDIYDLDDKLLIVTSDRLSAFDVVLDDPIPGKGEVLNRISVFWFSQIKDIIPHHLITAEVDEYPENLHHYRSLLAGRSMLVKKFERIDVECIARAYISGSLWKEYKQALAATPQGPVKLLGFEFPRDLQLSQRLPEVIFTPSTKPEVGHDENISFTQMTEMVGENLANKMKQATLDVFTKCVKHAESRGIILADTKFEFGLDGDQLVLIDEVCSPDSSRFWPMDKYTIGRAQESFDKQPVRDYLEQTGWDKNPPPPKLPPEVIASTSARYAEALNRLAG